MRYLVAENLISAKMIALQLKQSIHWLLAIKGAHVVTAPTMAYALSGPRGGSLLPGFPEWVWQAVESCLLC